MGAQGLEGLDPGGGAAGPPARTCRLREGSQEESQSGCDKWGSRVVGCWVLGAGAGAGCGCSEYQPATDDCV